jgi:hypothetical protein
LQRLLTTLDKSVLEMKESVDTMRPAYNQALEVLASAPMNNSRIAGAGNSVCNLGERDVFPFDAANKLI